jgi:Protein of unknown function (DUF2971)
MATRRSRTTPRSSRRPSSLLDPSVNVVIDQFTPFVKSLTPPDSLYHYTTFSGLKGILNDDALRATDSTALSDGKEWEFGAELIGKHRSVRARGDNYMDALKKLTPEAIFVTCFCKEPNLLSMWRSYTGDGGGFCLEFDGPELWKLQPFDRHGFSTVLVKVFYGDFLPSEMEGVLDSGGAVIVEWMLAAMLKHKGFQEEHEWRLLVTDPPASSMSFAPGHSSVKAFITLSNGGKLPLRSVVCGPTLHPESHRAVKWMLEKYGYPDVKVTGCDIPYRL